MPCATGALLDSRGGGRTHEARADRDEGEQEVSMSLESAAIQQSIQTLLFAAVKLPDQTQAEKRAVRILSTWLINQPRGNVQPDPANTAERWRDVPEFRGFVQASNRGNIRVLPHSDKLGRARPARLLPKHLNRTYYYVAVPARQGTRRNIAVHSLVCSAFHGPRPAGLQVGHLDGNPLNNFPANLKWVTAKENGAHRIIHGTASRKSQNVGSKNVNAKLSEADIPEIVRLRETGLTWEAIGKEFGVCHSTVYYAASGRSWRHVME